MVAGHKQNGTTLGTRDYYKMPPLLCEEIERHARRLAEARGERERTTEESAGLWLAGAAGAKNKPHHKISPS